MCGGNAPAVGPALDGIIAALQEARAALDAPDPMTALLPWLAPGHAMRAGWPPPLAAPLDIPARPDALIRLGRAGGWVRAVSADRSTVTVVRPAPRDQGGPLDDL
jgi:prephenate dehydrogenase